MNNWKIGAVSGLIAGIVSGIVAIYYALSMFNLGLPYWDIPSPPETPLMYITTVELTMNIIWGIVLGIFYSKVYDLIPGRRISKGLIYGIVLGLIWSIRWVTFNIAYSAFGEAKANVISTLAFIIYGLVLGVFYEFLQSKYHPDQKKLKISKLDIGMGIQAGVIGGFLGGIAIFFLHVLFWNPIDYPKFIADIGFLTAQLGTHSLINMGWGAVFGIFYARCYNRIPGRRVLKGIAFGMIIYFITSFRCATNAFLYDQIGTSISCANASILFLINGLVLGLLYRKPTEAIAVKKEKIRTFKMENCIHCGASIKKGSKFCNECGKKQ